MGWQRVCTCALLLYYSGPFHIHAQVDRWRRREEGGGGGGGSTAGRHCLNLSWLPSPLLRLPPPLFSERFT